MGELGLTSARRLSELFTEQYERGAFSAGQLVVRRGDIAFELCLGDLTAQRNDKEVAGHRTPVIPETRFQVMSASKPVVAAAIAMLEEQGLLHVDRAVAEIWPEFGAHGKEGITILDVLLHRSGLLIPGIQLPRSLRPLRPSRETTRCFQVLAPPVALGISSSSALPRAAQG